VRASLPVKVALWTFGLVALAATMALVVSLEQGRVRDRQDFRLQSRQTLEMLALGVGPDLAAGHHEGVQALVDNVANFPEHYPDLVALEVLDRDGRVVADLDPRRFGTRRADRRARRDLRTEQVVVRPAKNGLVEFVVPIRLAHRLGVLRARVSEARLDAAVERDMLRGSALMGSAALLLALTLYLVLKWTISDRIVRLARTASAFRGGNMAVRFQAKGRDETAQLGESFNRMATEIQRYTESLEHLVEDRTEALRKANEQLVLLAITDPLTGLYNRRHFAERAERDLELAKRKERAFALIMCDLDHFKTVNDLHGHAAGDAVIKHFAELLRDQARAPDLIARLGGEEFAIAMPDTPLRDALSAAERFRSTFEASHYGGFAQGVRRTTASFGVAVFPEDGDTIEQLLQAADRALYQAKHEGRNRVVPAARGPRTTGVGLVARGREGE